MSNALTLEELRSKYRDEILRLAEKHGIADVRIFGSVAKGTANEESDIDLLVRLLPSRHILDRVGFKLDVQRCVGRNVDVVNERGLKERLRERVLQEAVPL